MAFVILMAKFIKYSRRKACKDSSCNSICKPTGDGCLHLYINIIQMVVYLGKALILIKIIEGIWLLTNVC